MWFISRYFQYRKRVNLLIDRGWYRNLAGGFTEKHCMSFINKKDLYNIPEDEFRKIIRGK